MPRQLSLDGLIAKNKLEQDTPWIFLFDLQVDETTTLRFAKYPEEIIWNGQTYSPYYLRMDPLKEQSDGSLSQIKVTVANILRDVEALMQTRSGLRGKQVTIRVVHKDDPAAGELVQTFVITESTSTVNTAVFTLEKSLPALEVTLPRRVFTNEEFPGIQDRAKF